MDEFVVMNGKKRGGGLMKFWEQNREIVIRALSLILFVFLLCMIVRWTTISKMEREFEVRLAEAVTNAQEETEARLVSQYGTQEDKALRATIDAEARQLAKMLYPMQYNTENGLKSACWCAINRVESKYYPDTIEEVCSQNNQWMGWSESNPVTQRLYDIAYEQLALWHNGIHAVSTDFLFLEWNTKEITLRTNFNGKGHYWYESDWDQLS